jgi:predicted O-linked N-acetylglucosamine transferase (SPINDLY family)
MDAAQFKQCLAWLSQREFELAEEGCRRCLNEHPDNPSVLSLLGNVLLQSGRPDQAIKTYRQASLHAPHDNDIRFNLALALEACGQKAEAVLIYRQTLQNDPSYLSALHNLIKALDEAGDTVEADTLCLNFATLTKQQGLHTRVAGDWMQEGLEMIGRHAVALGILRLKRARQIDPELAVIAYNLGNALQTSKQFTAALEQYDDAGRLGMDCPELKCNRGIVLAEMGRFSEAYIALKQVTQHCPDYLLPYAALSHVSFDLGYPEQALDVLQQALARISPNTDHKVAAKLYQAYGLTLAKLREHDMAVSQLQKAISLDPDTPDHVSAYLMELTYLETKANRLDEIHRRQGSQHSSAGTLDKPRTPKTLLRIGIISADLREHSVAYFMEPLFANRDKRKISIVAYYNHSHADTVTARLKGHADQWRDIANLNTDELTDRINDDKIDVLIDLAGHTRGNRLDVFRRRVTPLQITYLGYPTITGVSNIDYRLSDSIIDPVCEYPLGVSEMPARLKHHFCYRPPVEPPPIREPGGDEIVFGSFNNLPKITDSTLDFWSHVLLSVPGSRLLLKSRGLACASVTASIHNRMGKCGVNPDRILLKDWIYDSSHHLDLYNEIDIALDSTPYNGATTTCEALWMGVPVVSLAGETHPSRMGASILSAAGLSNLIASSPQMGAEIAASLVSNNGKLNRIDRLRMRESVTNSKLCDEIGFMRDFEQLVDRLYHSGGS